MIEFPQRRIKHTLDETITETLILIILAEARGFARIAPHTPRGASASRALPPACSRMQHLRVVPAGRQEWRRTGSSGPNSGYPAGASTGAAACTEEAAQWPCFSASPAHFSRAQGLCVRLTEYTLLHGLEDDFHRQGATSEGDGGSGRYAGDVGAICWQRRRCQLCDAMQGATHCTLPHMKVTVLCHHMSSPHGQQSGSER